MDDVVFFIGLRYLLAPLALGGIIGLAQSLLFLRSNRVVAKWWPVVTGVTAMVPGLQYFFLIIISITIDHPPAVLGVFSILFMGYMYLGLNGFFIGLVQSGLLWWVQLYRRYVVGAMLSGVASVLANLGVLAVYQFWLSDPLQCPVGAEHDMLVWLQPALILVYTLVYGIGTSLVLARLRQAVRVNSPARP
jgi:hypothetical protein